MKNVPVLGEFTVFEAHDIGSDPWPRTTLARKATVGDDEVPFGKNHVIFIAKSLRKATNEIE